MTNQTTPTPSDDYDTPWKEILEGYLPEFLAFFFPAIYAEIDWSRGYLFLDKELQQVTRDAERGRRLADKLVKVWRYDGTDTWVLIHIEVQGQEEVAFAERMYVYNYRLFDRYQRTVVSMALLTDERANWRPDEYSRVLWDCGVRFWYPIAKLTDYTARQDELEQSINPFAAVVQAHLAAQATRRDPPTRAQLKFQLARRLYERGYARQQILDLYRFIDWVMRLPEDLDDQVWQQLRDYEEAQQMPYVTFAERYGRREGLKEGRAEQRDLVLRMLIKRFGPLDETTTARVAALPHEYLDDLALALLDFTAPAELVAWLDAVPENL